MVSKEFIQDAVRRYKESGLSVKEFCFNEGIGSSTFYYWLKKQREKEQSKKFIPIITHNQSEFLVRDTTESIKHTNSFTLKEDALLELVYPNGAVLRFSKNIDIPLLQVLVNLVNR